MKNILAVLLISCFCLNLISCASKTNSDNKGTFFFREVKGTWGWYPDGNEDTEGKYVGEIKIGKPHGQGTYIHYNGPKSSVNQLSLPVTGMNISIIFAITIFQLLNPGKQEQLSARYDGNWKRGEKHGEGKYFFPNGDRYEGRWLKGKPHGKGTYFCSKKTDRASISFPMGTLLWDNGKMGTLMEKEFTLIRAEKNLSENGRRAKNNSRGRLFCLTEQKSTKHKC